MGWWSEKQDERNGEEREQSTGRADGRPRRRRVDMLDEDADPAHNRTTQKRNYKPGCPGAPFYDRTCQPNQGGVKKEVKKVAMQEAKRKEPPVFAVKLPTIRQGPETKEARSVIDCAPRDLDAKDNRDHAEKESRTRNSTHDRTSTGEMLKP